MWHFLQALYENGNVSVGTERFVMTPRDLAKIVPTLNDFDRIARLNLCGTAPKMNIPAAIWASTLLYEVSQLLVLRRLGPEEIEMVFSAPAPEPTPENVYSTDLILVYLPGLLDLARRLAPNDPLVTRIEQFGLQWPLSSVAMRLSTPPTGPVHFLDHPSLKQLYIDRIIEYRAYSWINDWSLFESIRSSYGDNPQLCADLAEAIEIALANPEPASTA